MALFVLAVLIICSFARRGGCEQLPGACLNSLTERISADAAMIRPMEKDLAVLRSQQLPNKLFIAGGSDYDKIWIRDNVYVALALIEAKRFSQAASIYSGLLNIIKQYEHKLDLGKYPENDSELLYPRFSITGAEIDGHWGNKQHDAIGALLYGIGQLDGIGKEYVTGFEKLLAQKLVRYLEACRYWEDADSGMWEEAPALHASSLAACIKGIEMVSGFCAHDATGLEKAKSTLQQLLPRESSLHAVDMALLSLVWPYGYKRTDIVQNVETQLQRKHGVIRYLGDIYEADGSEEPEWVMGIPWLGIAYHELGDMQKARHYLAETEKLYTGNGLPESYLANNEACVHTPLAWSHSMALILRAKLAGMTSLYPRLPVPQCPPLA